MATLLLALSAPAHAGPETGSGGSAVGSPARGERGGGATRGDSNSYDSRTKAQADRAKRNDVAKNGPVLDTSQNDWDRSADSHSHLDNRTGQYYGQTGTSTPRGGRPCGSCRGASR